MPFLLLFGTILTFSLIANAAPVTIAAGPFQMGCSPGDPACEHDEGPPGGIRVEVPAFRIDEHEVTVAEYRACVESGRCTPPLTHTRNKYCNYGAPGRDDHPVNCVDWTQAQTFCRTRGGRLPYEAEWEKAARGGTTSRYPWGQRVSCREAILDDKITHG
ncbi:MAG: formylglycine-generating enzyme family protein, partial [Gammaproteobacteria bacterium]